VLSVASDRHQLIRVHRGRHHASLIVHLRRVCVGLSRPVGSLQLSLSLSLPALVLVQSARLRALVETSVLRVTSDRHQLIRVHRGRHLASLIVHLRRVCVGLSRPVGSLQLSLSACSCVSSVRQTSSTCRDIGAESHI